MELFTPEVLEYIDRSVLCWLATASKDGSPNVSPKEVFISFGTDQIIIANIASPQTVKNIKENPHVCISFIDVLIQKGYQLKGQAKIISKNDLDFQACNDALQKITQGKYPFATITQISVDKVKQILAPSYLLYPDITESQRIELAKKAYGLNP